MTNQWKNCVKSMLAKMMPKSRKIMRKWIPAASLNQTKMYKKEVQKSMGIFDGDPVGDPAREPARGRQFPARPGRALGPIYPLWVRRRPGRV